VNTVLIAGASGVIGAGAVEHFGRLPGWRVFALSRRAPVVLAGCAFTHVPVDLDDAAACDSALAGLPPITHLVYAAVKEAPGLAAGWRDPDLMAANLRMFAHLLQPLAASGRLRHVSLMQGAKAYGAHVHPVEVPLRENAPRDPHANFYWLHEDLLRATSASASAGFTFTIWRPQVLLGSAPGAAMNPVAAIGAYVAICRERGLPFALPGKSEALLELVDTDLLAAALAWAADAPAAAGQTFNITNGDVFVLRHAWPKLAGALGIAISDTAHGVIAVAPLLEVRGPVWSVPLSPQQENSHEAVCRIRCFAEGDVSVRGQRDGQDPFRRPRFLQSRSACQNHRQARSIGGAHRL
jgi:nucleoside-diphosphate-sugar epimerase